MRLLILCITVLGAATYAQRLANDAARQSRQYLRVNDDVRGYAPVPAGFRPTPLPQERKDTVASSQYQRRQNYDENYPVNNAINVQTPRPYQQQQQQQVRRPGNIPNKFRQQLIEEAKVNPLPDEEEKEEPDRLTELLTQSKFDCNAKNTGYYADDGLGCEVFHYCQNNVKHSWICPEGFTFHQVHLICMPPSGDNICEKSSEYHFVNDYLYKALNEEEVQTKPNTTLRYSDRYYPDSYYQPSREIDEDEQPSRQQQVHHRQRQPVRVGFQSSTPQPPQQQIVQLPRARPTPLHFAPTLRPEPQQIAQVFHSPEEVNISLQQRRPHSYIPQRGYFQEIEYK